MRIICVLSYILAICCALTACALHGKPFWIAVGLALIVLSVTCLTYIRSTT